MRNSTTCAWDTAGRRPAQCLLLPPLRPVPGRHGLCAGHPIVRREDEAAFGKYRTKEMILAYMNALAAGDTETVVAV